MRNASTNTHYPAREWHPCIECIHYKRAGESDLCLAAPIIYDSWIDDPEIKRPCSSFRPKPQKVRPMNEEEPKTRVKDVAILGFGFPPDFKAPSQTHLWYAHALALRCAVKIAEALEDFSPEDLQNKDLFVQISLSDKQDPYNNPSFGDKVYVHKPKETPNE